MAHSGPLCRTECAKDDKISLLSKYVLFVRFMLPVGRSTQDTLLT